MVKRLSFFSGLATSIVILLVSFLVMGRASASPALVQTASIQPAQLGAPSGGSSVIHYQGRLLDPSTGQAKPDGAYVMNFSLYDVETAGSPLWSETKNLGVNRGLFSTLLGDTTFFPADLFNGQTLYLGITVGSDPETAPRQRIASVAYAIFASTSAWADTLDGQDSTAFAQAQHTHTGDDIVDGTISRADLAADVVPKFISINPMGAYLEGAATRNMGYGPNMGIHFPDGAQFSSFGIGFTIPPNYTEGTPLIVHMDWNTPSTGCGIAFLGNSISVARPGRTHLVGSTTATGITVEGGTTLIAPGTANQTTQTFIDINSPVANETLKPGDSIIFSLYRSPSSGVDTCTGDMVIQNFAVYYQ